MDAITALTNLQSAAARSAIRSLVVSLCTLAGVGLGKQISPDTINKAIDQGFLWLPVILSGYFQLRTVLHSRHAKQAAVVVAQQGPLAPGSKPAMVYPKI